MTEAVILDSYTANPGDLSWERLEQIVDLTVFDRTPADLTIERIGDTEIIMTNKVIIDRAVIEACPNLKYIGVMATGYNVVDLNAAREKGIIVTNIPSYSTDSVAQHVFACILGFASGVEMHNRSVHNGDWVKSEDFSYTLFSLMEIAGKSLGVIGYGAIGKEVAKIGAAFGMEVLVHTGHPDDNRDVEFVNRDQLIERSDFITLHTVLNSDTEGMVNNEFLSSMKETAILINTGRGDLVDESALAEALNEGTIAGAALDVLSKEPPYDDNPLLKAKNCVITPHIAWATREARGRLIDTLVRNIQSYLEGKPENMII